MNSTGPAQRSNSHIITPSDWGRSLISVSDASAFFYREIQKNIPPYQAQILELNNGLVEKWRDEVLQRLADDTGMLEAETSSISMKVFLDGLEAISLFENGYFDLENEVKEPKELKILSEASLEKLWGMKTSVVMFMMQTLTVSMKLALAQKRYIEVYQHSSEPHEWYRLSQKHKELVLGGYIPFGLTQEKLKDITEKVGTILSIVINPFA